MATRVPSIYSNNFGFQIFGLLYVIREIHPAFKIAFGFDLTENSTELKEFPKRKQDCAKPLHGEKANWSTKSWQDSYSDLSRGVEVESEAKCV